MKPDTLITPGEDFKIVLNRFFVRYLEAVDAEILLYVETLAPEDPNPQEPDRRLILFKDGQPHRSFLPLKDVTLYGPTSVPEYPLRMRIVLVELDKDDNEKLNEIISNAQSAASSSTPQAALFANLGASIAKLIVANNTDDFEFDMTLEFHPYVRNGATTEWISPNGALSPTPFQEMTLVLIKDESPFRRVPPEDAYVQTIDSVLLWPNLFGLAYPSDESCAWDSEENKMPELVMNQSGELLHTARYDLTSDRYGQTATFWSKRQSAFSNVLTIPFKLLLFSGSRFGWAEKVVNDRFQEKTYCSITVSRAGKSINIDSLFARDSKFIQDKLISNDATATARKAAMDDFADALQSIYTRKKEYDRMNVEARSANKQAVEAASNGDLAAGKQSFLTILKTLETKVSGKEGLDKAAAEESAEEIVRELTGQILVPYPTIEAIAKHDDVSRINYDAAAKRYYLTL